MSIIKKENPDYIKNLKEGKGCIEFDTILLTLFLQFEVQIYTLKETGLIKQTFKFTRDKAKRIRIYLEHNGKFDILYDKATIKAAGICQSILLDVNSSFTF